MCSSRAGTLGAKHKKKSLLSINTNRAPCSIICYTKQPVHVRKLIISGERRLILLLMYQLNSVFQQKKQRERKHKGENIASSRLTAQCWYYWNPARHPPAGETSHPLPSGTATKINKYSSAAFCPSLLSELCG